MKSLHLSATPIVIGVVDRKVVLSEERGKERKEGGNRKEGENRKEGGNRKEKDKNSK